MAKPIAFVFALIVVSALAHASSAESPWQLAAKVDVPARSSKVLLVHHEGVDLAVGLRSGQGSVIEQDGPDQAFGTEAIVIDNQSEASARYEILVKAVLKGVEARYRIEHLTHPTATERDTAQRLSDLSQRWATGASADDALALARNALRGADGRLRALTQNAYLDILSASGRSVDVIKFLDEQSTQGNAASIGIADQVYRDHERAKALWESMQIQPALGVAERVAQQIAMSARWKSEVPPRVRQSLELSIKATLGAVRIFAGRERDDRKLMEQGGNLIATTLKSVPQDAPCCVRALLKEYLAGYYFLVLGRTSEVSANLYREAEEAYEAAGDRLSLATIRNNQAYAKLSDGDVQAALRLYLQVLDLQRTSRHLETHAHLRARLGYLYYTIGDYRRGEIRLRESIELYKKIHLHSNAVHDQLQLAELLQSDGRPVEALALLEEVRERKTAQLSGEDRLRLTSQLAAVYLDSNDVKAAEKALGTLGPLERFESNHWNSLQHSIRLFYLLDLDVVRARLDMAKGLPRAAKQRAERALSQLGQGRREPLQQLRLLHLQLAILDREKDEQSFSKTGERALALIESIRGSIDFHTQGPAWSARTSDINTLVVSHYLTRYERNRQANDFERAFAVMQSTRARNLRDTRTAIAKNQQEEVNQQAARAAQKANQALISALLLERSSESLERRLARAEELYQLNKKAPSVERATPVVLSASEIRRRLDPDSEVRVLFAGETASFGISLKRDAVSLVRLPDAETLSVLVEASRKELIARDPRLARTRELAGLLFPTRGDALPSRLLAETDGVFSAVPFSILLDLAAQGQTPPSIAVVPSLSEMFSASAQTASNASPHRKDLVVFADPAFDLSLTAAASQKGRSGFARLPYSRIEAKSIATYFDDNAVETFSDADATIANIMSDTARRARVLHIAAHGFGSVSDPFLVGLGLANPTSANESGLLTTQHINAVRYENELIVISACESAQGQRLDGEGLMSVGRAFLASGARATLSTLWPVPDRANAEFMKTFYRSLTQMGHDAPAALVFAQQEMKRSRLFNHPSFWGAFALHVADDRYQPVVSKVASTRAEAP